MRVAIVSIGVPRDGAIARAVQDYETRAARYFRLEAVEVPAAASHRGEPLLAREAEAEAILRRLPKDLEAWAVTRSGSALTSRDLAGVLADMATYSAPGIAFVIGGAFGLSEKVLERCRRRLSLSALTLPHDLARLVLAEQLYRAGTILRGEPYHKGD